MMNLSWRHFGVLAACLLVVDVHARAPELGETLGIGELLDGSFLVVSSGGRAKEVEVPRSLFFTASSMASDGRFIVGYSDRGFHEYAGEQRVSVEQRLAWGGYLLLRAVDSAYTWRRLLIGPQT
jgi:hypothetical protein